MIFTYRFRSTSGKVDSRTLKVVMNIFMAQREYRGKCRNVTIIYYSCYLKTPK